MAMKQVVQYPDIGNEKITMYAGIQNVPIAVSC